MTREEEKEFEQLALMQEFEAQEAQNKTSERVPGQTHFVDPVTGRTTKLPEQPSREQLITEDAQMAKESLQATGFGAVKGIPFAKDAIAAGEALYSTGTQNFGEAYTRNRQSWDKAINEAEAKSPVAFGIGQLGASISLPITGTAGAGIGTIIGASAVFGAAQAISDLEDRNPYAMAEAGLVGSSIGAATSGGMIAVGKSIKYVGERLGVLANNTVKEAVGAITEKHKAEINKHIRKTGTKGATDIQQTAEFADRVLKTQVNGQPLLGGITGQRYSETALKAKAKRMEYGEQLGEVIEVMEANVKAVDGRVIYDRVVEKLKLNDKLRSDIPATRDFANKAIIQLKEMFTETTEEVIPMAIKVPMGATNVGEEVVDTVTKKVSFKKMSPQRVTEMKLDHAENVTRLGNAFENAADPSKASSLSLGDDFNMALNSAFSRTMEDFNQELAKKAPQLADKYKNINRDWSDMLLVERLSNERALREGGGALEKFKNALSVRGLLVAQVSNSTGANMAISAGVASTINEVLQSPKTTTKMANSLNLIKNHISTFKDSPFLKRIMVAAASASYDGNNEPLDKALASSASEISLMNMPVKRSLNDLKNKSDDVLQALEYHDPETASLVRQALDDNDDESLRALMDQASKNPKMSKYFEQGSGIDGRVFSEEDKAMYRTQIEKANIPLKDKLILKNQLDSNGSIPKFPQPEDRTLRYMKRDKSKPMF